MHLAGDHLAQREIMMLAHTSTKVNAAPMPRALDTLKW